MSNFVLFLIWASVIVVVGGVTYLMVIVSDQLKEDREQRRQHELTRGIRK